MEGAVSVWAAYRGLLRNRPLSRLLLGEFVSSIGDGVYYVALVVLVYSRTGDAAILGAVGAGILVPKFVLSIPAGVIADRFDRRRVLLASDIGCGLCMLVLAGLVSIGADILPIAAVTVLATCFATFFTPAFGALLPSLVRDESEYGPANSAWATLDNFAWVFGPAVAGAILLIGSLEFAFVLNAASYLLVAAVLWRLPRPARVADAARSHPVIKATGARFADGRKHRWSLRVPSSIDLSAVAGIVLLNAASWLSTGGMTILLVIIAVDVLRAGEEATGYLNVALGLGGAVGAVLSGVMVLRPRLAPALLLAGAAAGAALLLQGVAPALPIALLAVGVASLGQMVLDVAMTTIFQRVVPDTYRGRFTGLIITSSSFADSGGTLVVPMLIGGLGIGVVLGSLGVLLFGATVAALLLIGRAADVEPGPFDAQLRRLARLPIFGGLRAGQVEAGLRRFQPLRVGPGTVVIRELEPADRFYVVAEGSFDVAITAPDGRPRHIRTLGVDDVFGERGILTHRPRTATVTALTPGLLFTMDGPAFLELVTRRPGSRERFLELYDRPANEVATP